LPQILDFLIQKGYARFSIDGKVEKIEKLLENKAELTAISKEANKHQFQILVDRFVINKDDAENAKRIADSVETALQEGHGVCILQLEDGSEKFFNNRFELDGIVFEDPSPQLFNFNSSLGAC